MRILTLTTPNMENGLGCRVTIWVAGCNHHCEGCHNKHTWDYAQGQELTDENVKNKIFNAVDHKYIQGITISGGDPLAQSEQSLVELSEFLKVFKNKFPDKDIWIYTGSIYEDTDANQKMVTNLCDVLVDGPFKKECAEIDLAFRGSSNQRIIDLNKTRETGHIVLLKIK